MSSEEDLRLEAEFRRLSTASISDVTGQSYTMRSHIRPLVHGVKISGRAVTVQTEPGDASKPTEAVGLARKGDIIVIDARGFEESACWGGNDSIGSKTKGLSGVIVDGAVRDTAEIREMGFPTWAKAVTPRTGGGKGGGAVNIPIVCGGVSISPGDIVVADDDGVVVVPKDEANAILQRSIAREALEKGITKKVLEGLTLADALASFHFKEG
jgi:regulator of RNase E activity RraA